MWHGHEIDCCRGLWFQKLKSYLNLLVQTLNFLWTKSFFRRGADIAAKWFPSTTYSNSKQPNGKAADRLWVPEFTQQKLVQTVPKWAAEPTGSDSKQSIPSTTPSGAVKSWVADLWTSNALHGQPRRANAPAISARPQKNSMKKHGSLASATCKHVMLGNST